MSSTRTVSAEHELIRTLHSEHAAALWAFSLRLTGGDRAAAEDVVQETLLRAWRDAQKPSSGGGSAFTVAESKAARGWLYTVARRIVIDEWRARSARPERLVWDAPESGTADPADQLVVSQLMTDAMDRLSPEHRAVLFEMFYRRSSVTQAAQSLGIAEGTVKSRTHYALRALKLALAELGETGVNP